MSVLVTVNFNVSAEVLAEAEQRDPGPIQEIGKFAQKYMTSHTRYSRDGHTMDVDTYKSVEDYEAFFELAKDHIAKYAANAGATVQDTVWEKQAE